MLCYSAAKDLSENTSELPKSLAEFLALVESEKLPPKVVTDRKRASTPTPLPEDAPAKRKSTRASTARTPAEDPMSEPSESDVESQDVYMEED